MTITDQITALLSADPVCGGRVTGETVRAIAALVAGWQPIENAPKDGASVLGHADGDCAVVHYSSGEWQLTETGLYAEDGRWQPTHWMPLPPPPIERGDFGAGEG